VIVSPQQLSGSSSAVERQLPKLDVAGSIPVSRSNVLKRLRYSGNAASPNIHKNLHKSSPGTKIGTVILGSPDTSMTARCLVAAVRILTLGPVARREGISKGRAPSQRLRIRGKGLQGYGQQIETQHSTLGSDLRPGARAPAIKG
jgi:hypothetical protein